MDVYDRRVRVLLHSTCTRRRQRRRPLASRTRMRIIGTAAALVALAPAGTGWRFLTIKVFEPAAGTELFTDGAERTIEVGEVTGYVTGESDWSSRSTAVIGPGTPHGFLPAVDYDMRYGMAENDLDRCEKVVPQTGKVLEALGWV